MLLDQPDKPSLSPADAALIAGLAFLSIVAQGHNFGVGNNAVYISWMGRLGPEALFQNDWYLNTAPLHQLVIQPLIFLHQHLPLDWSFLIAHTLTRLLFCTGVYLLAIWMFESRAAAILAVVFNILFPRISLGGHFAQASHFEANFLGFALAVLAFAFYIRGRSSPRAYIGMGLFTGLALLLHFFIGVYAAAILAITLFLDVRRGDLHWQWLVFPVVIALGIAAPSFWSVLQSGLTDQQIMTSVETANVLAFRHPHHHVPSAWPLSSWIDMGLYIALWLVLFHKHLTSLEIVTAVWTLITCAVFTICVEIIPFAPVAYFQFFRQTVFLTIFLSVHMGGWCARILSGRPSQPVANVIYLIIVAGLIGTYRFPDLFPGTALVAWGTLALFRIMKLAPRRLDYLGISSAQSAGAWLFCFAGVGLWAAGAMGYLNPLASHVRERPHFAIELRAGSPELAEACAWVKENTAEDAVFLIPPDIEEFRILSERAIVVDWKTIPYRNGELYEWFDRIARTTSLLSLQSGLAGHGARHLTINDEPYTQAALDGLNRTRHWPVSDLAEAYDNHSEIMLDSLARRYGAEYILTRRSFPKPVLFSNSSYFVYQIKN